MIQLYENKNSMFNDSIDKIVVEMISKKKTDAKCFLFTGCSNYSGTTTISMAVAIALANTNRKVMFIDCDFRKELKYKKSNRSMEIGLADYLERSKEGSENIGLDQLQLDTNIENLYMFPCGECKINPTRLLCSSDFEKTIKDLEERYDFIILDVPSISIVPDASALLPVVDHIILVSAIGETSKDQIHYAKRKAAHYADKYFGMIINKVDMKEYRQVIRNYDYYLEDKTGNQNLKKKIRKSVKK